MQFWLVSLQNRLKMCGFLRGITWATGRHENRLQLVHATGFFIFEEGATVRATAGTGTVTGNLAGNPKRKGWISCPRYVAHYIVTEINGDEGDQRG